MGTQHCLTGCVIAEVIGLLLGVSLGWPPLTTALVATVLAFITGFALTLIPMTLKQGRSVGETLGIVWLGETVSIGIMELAMNVVDYLLGGCLRNPWPNRFSGTACFSPSSPVISPATRSIILC